MLYYTVTFTSNFRSFLIHHYNYHVLALLKAEDPYYTERLRRIIGDADMNGDVSILDVTAIQRQLAQMPTASYSEELADADGDGEATIIDATLIQRYDVDMETGCPIGEMLA